MPPWTHQWRMLRNFDNQQLSAAAWMTQSTASGQASFAGVLCAKRTAKNRWTDQKMNKFIFWLAIGFSYARKLSLRRSSFRRKLFVIVAKLVRPLRSRR